MGILTIMAKLTAKRIAEGFNPTTATVVKTPTPLGMHQGSAITLPSLDIALAQADGSIFKEPIGIQLVSAVGQYTLFGMTVYNVYLNDGNAFVQLVVDASQKLQEARLFCNYQTVDMASLEDWEFWLGRYDKDAYGELVRDANGIGIVAEYGLIGWPSFQIDGEPPIVYNRTWFSSNDGVVPVEYLETVADSAGNTTLIKHEAMEYYRTLGDTISPLYETLIASMVQEEGKGSVDILIGIPLDINSIKVLQA